MDEYVSMNMKEIKEHWGPVWNSRGESLTPTASQSTISIGNLLFKCVDPLGTESLTLAIGNNKY